MTGFPRSPRQCDLSETDLHNLVEYGLIPDTAQYGLTASELKDHPRAARLFRQFKAGSDTLTKTDAYEIGNELNRQAARIRELEAELENGGRAYSAKSPNVGGAALPADVGRDEPPLDAKSREIEDAIDDALDAGEWPNEGGRP